MKVALLADLHGRLQDVEPCDLLVVAGDLTPIELLRDPERRRAWVEAEVAPWLERQPAAEIVGIAGNCDIDFADDPGLPRSLPWRYLEDEAAEVAGLQVFGSPLSLPFGPWPFMEPEERLAEVWASIPEETELLVVHGPPHGLGDRASSGVDAGSHSLTARLAELPQLRAVVFGHIHEARGRGRVGGVDWVNAAAAAGEEPFLLDL